MEENIIYKNANGIEYIQFKKLLEFGINHCYTLKGENIDFGAGCEHENDSFNKICNALNINQNELLIPKQTHTDIVKCVNENTKAEEIKGVDGLITDKKNMALVTKNADCILFLFYDPIKKVIANVHSGWRGTFKKIAEKAVLKMITNYGCKAEDIYCFISPSIRKCHFEVDEDVKELCENIFEFTGRTNEFIQKGEIKDDKQKYYIDTILINQILLEDIGLKPENIIDSNLCSVCNKDRINSSRVEGKNFKRAIALIKM